MSEKKQTVVWIESENALLRDCLRERIDGHGAFRVEHQASGSAELLHLLKRQQPDVLLFDAETSGAVPEALLPRLRSRWPEVRILLLAPRADDHIVARALRYGAMGVLARGEGLPQLLHALDAVAKGQIWARRQAIARALSGLQPVAPQPSAAAPALTPRERQLLGLLSDGYRNKELAAMLRIKEQTVKVHLHSLFRKLNVRTRVEAALKAAELVQPTETNRVNARGR